MKRLIISDTFDTTKEIVINDLSKTMIPRIGDTIVWNYQPYPKVIYVALDYDDGFIFVKIA